MKIELRSNENQLIGNESGGLLRVSGYVNKTGQWSQMLGRSPQFKERIEKGAFQRAIDKAKNILFLAEHDNAKVLSSIEAGSLSLREDENGLFIEAEIAPTSWGRDYHTLVERNLAKGMSFGMKVLKDSWKKLSDGTYERSISDLELFEISITKNPAYLQSSIEARSIELIENPKIEEGVFNNMNLNAKELKEKKQDLLKQAKQLQGIMESRSLDDTEKLQAHVLEDELRSITEQIQTLEKTNTSKGDTNKMNNEMEIRAVDQFIRNQDGEELRAVTTGASPGAMTIPTYLHDEVVEKLFEVAPLFAMSKNFTPVNGFLEILREQSLGEAAEFVNEMSTVGANDFTMDKIKLEQRRVATSIELSQHLINDSGIDVVKYATNVLIRRMGQTLDRTVLKGDKTLGQFEGLLKSESIGETSATTATGITIDNLLDLYTSMNPEFVKGAVFVVSRPVFNLIAKLKDGFGHYHLVRDVAENGVTYKLFECPVLINDAMPPAIANQRSVFFANFAEGYATMTKKGMELKKIDNDSVQASKGATLLILDAYMDGKILNPDAIKALKQPSA